MDRAPSISDIESASKTVARLVQETACWHASKLSEIYGCNVFLKREDRQKVRSYKIRGAFNKICRMVESGGKGPVVCASAGNHAQGVAYSCSELGVRGVIFMPVTTPAQKIDAVRYFGKDNVDIRLVGDCFDESASEALAYAAANGMVFVPPFDDPDIIAGQATVAVELLAQMKERGVVPDIVFVPIGGGGLASGVGLYLKSASPSTRVIGVEPVGAASMKAAIAAGGPVTLDSMDTFVDGAAVGRAGDLTYGICSRVLDDIVVVPEGAVCTEMLGMYNRSGIVLEPAGALTVTALRFCGDMTADRNVCCILSGSNNDIARIDEIRRRSEEFENNQ